jgi:acyl transferase domain-containing protein/acyl carrier protein
MVLEMDGPVRIAVVGMGCRFPGGASSPEAFWDLLEGGRDVVTPVPRDRWDYRRFLATEQPCPSGKTHVKEAGFLTENPMEFDPEFFSISPREAEAMDPQQRLLLEVCYEALEDAGCRIEEFRRRRVGVFVGGFTLDNMGIRTRMEMRSSIESTDATSFSLTLLANRLSHFYDWTGPSMAIDTACSSALTAIHEACRSLRDGECEMAVAGGVNVILGPDSSTAMSRGGFLSPRCRSRAFDRSADGYARGEGAGLVVLKTLHRAEADGDHIHAIIRGTVVNQDGRTTGIALPNPESQEALLRDAYADADVDLSQVRFIEAHGTGTSAGDQIELRSIRSVFAPSPARPLYVSSVKTNIGHLEAAAGVAGLIKAVLCLKKKQLPPHLHLEDPIPELEEGSGLRCPTSVIKLPDQEAPLLAGVNSFGYGGANAHLILEEAVSAGRRPRVGSEDPGDSFPELVRISAQSKEALRQMAGDHARWLEEHADEFPDWKHTLMHHRSRHRFALTLPSEDPESAREALRVFAETGQPDPGSMVGRVAKKSGPLVFVCTGMGPQWWGMGRELFVKAPVFAEVLKHCDSVFRGLSGWSILDEMLAEEGASRMAEPEVSQPANFCLQVALAALWKEWGIHPDAIVGHSVGEIGAAYLAGALTLEEAMAVSLHRSRLQQSLRGTGGMLAVGMGEEEALDRISNREGISLAAVNSPVSVTLAGSTGPLKELAAELERDGFFQRMLAVDIPYHSAAMERIQSEFRGALDGLHPSPTGIPLYSTVTGDRLDGAHCHAGYWWSNLRLPVRFERALRRLISEGYRTFLEVGPHPVLARSIREIAESEGCELATLSSMKRGEPEFPHVGRTRGHLDILGHPLPSKRGAGHRVPLPAYPWQKRYLWRVTEEFLEDTRGRPGAHVFLQSRGRTAGESWETEWNRLYFPYLEDHVVRQAVVWPGAAYVEAGLALNLERNNGNPATLQGIRFHRLLRREADCVQRLSTRIDPPTGRWTVACGRVGDLGDWSDYASGTLIPRPLSRPPEPSELHPDGFEDDVFDSETFYSGLRSMGLEYRGWFRGVRRIRRRGRSLRVEIAPPGLPDPSEDGYQIHPVLLDAVFQAFAAAVIGCPERETWIPTEIGEVHFFRPAGRSILAEVTMATVEEERLVGRATLWNADGEAVATLEGVVFRKIARMPGEVKRLVYHPEWEEAALPEGSREPGLRGRNLIVLPPPRLGGGFAKRIGERLTGGAVVCHWAEGTGTGEPASSIRRAIGNPERTSPAQVVFVAASGSDEGGEESLWNLIKLVRSELWNEDNKTPPVLSVLTAGVFGIGNDGSPVSTDGAALWGAASVIANECPSVPIRVIDLPPHPDEATLLSLTDELRTNLVEHEILLRGGSRWIRGWKPDLPEAVVPETELVAISGESATRLGLQASRGAGLSGIHHVRRDRREPGPHEVEIAVEVAGLNFKDLLKVLGQIPQQALEETYFRNSIGLEFSGVVLRTGRQVESLRTGDRVCAFSPEGCFASHVVTPETLVLPLPVGISFEDGACLVPWITAWQALEVAARLQSGETVLIHSAAGGVGLAALQVAKAAGAVVIATASSEVKRRYLSDCGADCVLDSGSLEFVGEVRRFTEGRGVDVILNSLAGDALVASFGLLAPCGRFIEIGKRDIIENQGLPMGIFNRNASFIAIDLDRMFIDRPDQIRLSLKECVEALAGGRFVPLPCETLPASEAEKAFRLMGDRSRIGRVNLRYAGESAAVKVDRGKLRIRPDKAYLVTGGTGGLGLSIARWLVEEGAKRLVLLGRTGMSGGTARNWIEAAERGGVEILAPPTDLSDRSAMQGVFSSLRERDWSLAGVWHCALALEDARLGEIDREQIRRVFAGKVRGAQVLESLLEGEPELDFWISFSSVSTLLGNPGQCIYAAANTWLEQWAEKRHRLGKPALTLLLGYLGDTGVASRSPEIVRHLENAGLREMSSRQVAAAFPGLLGLDRPVLGFFDLDWDSWDRCGFPISGWHRFSHLVSAKSSDEAEARFLELRMEIAGKDAAERALHIESRITALLSEVLAIPADRIDPETPISQLGIDSLMAMEFLAAGQRKMGIRFSEAMLARDPCVSDLRGEVLSKFLPENEPATTGSDS